MGTDCRLACACTPCRRYACVVLCGCEDLIRAGLANLTCTWASSAGSVGFARGRGGRRWRRGSPFPAPGACGAPLSALPRTVQHFIESHHGTTLVEYFYHRAKQQAKARAGVVGTGGTTREQIAAELADPDAVEVPDEFEYRYPGPKPRTKEAAILMIADACESASRSLIEPTPSRIEALVRGIARKRLDDGQFDDCEITLRDLSRISESVARTLSSIHHGRIAYPGDAKKPESARPESGVIAPKSSAVLR